MQPNSEGEAVLCVDNSHPALLVEATHSAPLASIVPLPSHRYAAASSVEGWDCSLILADVCSPCSTDWTGLGCSVQMTHFACGGVVLGLAAFHCLMDAQASATFAREWADSALS